MHLRNRGGGRTYGSTHRSGPSGESSPSYNMIKRGARLSYRRGSDACGGSGYSRMVHTQRHSYQVCFTYLGARTSSSRVHRRVARPESDAHHGQFWRSRSISTPAVGTHQQPAVALPLTTHPNAFRGGTTAWQASPFEHSDLEGIATYQSLRQHAGEAWADSTRKVYASAWNAFVSWCLTRSTPIQKNLEE